MASRIMPGIGLKADWDLGEDGWKDEMDTNLRVLSVVAGQQILEIVAAEPGAPAEGDIVILDETHATHPNEIAVYDEAGWHYIIPIEGMQFYNLDDGERYEFVGAVWVVMVSGGGGAATNWKDPVRAATTAAVVLASALENGDTIDGVVLATGDRILVKNQAAPEENGIYVVNAAGAPTRAIDADTGSELVNATVKISEGTTLADQEWQCTTNAPIIVGTTGLVWQQSVGGGSGGVQQFPILAAAMTSRTSNGPAVGTTETVTNKVMLLTLDFDPNADEFAQIMLPMPKSWNEGTLTVQFLWTAAGGTAAQVVVWGAQGGAFSDDDPLDAAFGAAVTVNDALTAVGDLMISAATGAITIGGSPAEGDLVCLQFYRDADNGSDNLTVDAKLIGVRINVTTNAADDS